MFGWDRYFNCTYNQDITVSGSFEIEEKEISIPLYVQKLPFALDNIKCETGVYLTLKGDGTVSFDLKMPISAELRNEKVDFQADEVEAQIQAEATVKTGPELKMDVYLLAEEPCVHWAVNVMAQGKVEMTMRQGEPHMCVDVSVVAPIASMELEINIGDKKDINNHIEYEKEIIKEDDAPFRKDCHIEWDEEGIKTVDKCTYKNRTSNSEASAKLKVPTSKKEKVEEKIYNPETDEEQIKIIGYTLARMIDEQQYRNMKYDDDVYTIWCAIDYYVIMPWSGIWKTEDGFFIDERGWWNSTPDKYGHFEYDNMYKEEVYRLSGTRVRYYLETLYAGMNVLPQIPEDMRIWYDENSDEYLFGVGELGAGTVPPVIKSIKEDNGKITVVFEFWAGEDEYSRKVADNTMVLVKNADEEAYAAGFKFSVESFKQYNNTRGNDIW